MHKQTHRGLMSSCGFCGVYKRSLRRASVELLRLLDLRTQTKLRDRSMLPEVCQADSMMTFKEKDKSTSLWHLLPVNIYILPSLTFCFAGTLVTASQCYGSVYKLLLLLLNYNCSQLIIFLIIYYWSLTI